MPAGDVRSFIDTNVLLYAYDASDTTRHPAAAALVGELGAGARQRRASRSFKSST